MDVPPVGVEDPSVLEALRAYVKLLRAAKAVVARIEPAAAARGLTLTQLGVLEALLHKGPLTQRELGRKVLTSAGNMTDVIDKLEARELVRRTRKPGDRRAVSVELTAGGRDTIEGLFPRHARDIAAAMGGLSIPELRQLGGLLRKLGQTAGTQQEGLAGEGGSNQLSENHSTSNEPNGGLED
ncbi:MAG: MarR family transcriptional regulator [Pseudomonadota bacterium]|nr:MarR family transcriptional regulator [Pseudomonadota bacterium]